MRRLIVGASAALAYLLDEVDARDAERTIGERRAILVPGSSGRRSSTASFTGIDGPARTS